VGSQAWPLIGDFNQDGFDDLYIFGMGNEGGEHLNTLWTGTHHQLFLQDGPQGLVSPADTSAVDSRRSIVHGAAIGDIDSDGDLDIFNGTLGWSHENVAATGVTMVGSHFFINDGSGNFSRDTSRLVSGFAELGYDVQAALLVDIDNDSDLDLLLTGSDLDKLKPEGEIPLPVFSIFRNDGTGHFQRAEAGLVPSEDPVGEGWNTSIMESADVDGDGWQDIFVNLQGPDLISGNVQLLMNNGDGTFRDASENMLLDTPWSPESEGGYVLRFFAKDFNGDNWPDLFTLGSGILNRLLINQGDGTLVEVSSNLDDLTRDSTRSLDIADIDGDGDPNIVQTLACNVTTEFCPTMVVSRNIGNFRPVTPPPLPKRVKLRQPADSTQLDLPPVLTWRHMAGAQEYRAQVSQSPSFATNGDSNLDLPGITGNLLDLAKLTSLKGFDALQSNTRYYWRVAATNYRGQGAWSEPRSFDFGEVTALSINAGHSGAWFNTATSGQGQFIDVEPASQFMFVSWFTYTDAASANPNEQRWFTAQGNYSGNTAELPLFETLGGRFDDPQAVTTTQIGEVTLSFSDCEQGQMTYSLDEEGLQGEFPLLRMIPGSENVCKDLAGTSPQAVDINAGMDGAWFDPNTPGQGFFIDAHPDPEGGNFIFVSWFTFGEDTASGQRWLTAQGSFEGSIAEIDVFETTGGSFDDPQEPSTTKVGTMSLNLTDCSNAQLSYSLTDTGAEGDIEITRVIPGGQALCEELEGAD